MLTPLSLPFFLGGTAFMKRFKFTDGAENIYYRFQDTAAASLCYWPFVDLVTFSLVPI